MAIAHPFSGNPRRLIQKLALLALCLVIAPFENLLFAPAAHADSEASSEAGLEANVWSSRRRRRRGLMNNAYVQQQNKMQMQQQKQLQNRLSKNQAQQNKHEQRLASMPDRAFIREYGGGKRRNPASQNFQNGSVNNQSVTAGAGSQSSAPSAPKGGGKIPGAVSGNDELAPYRGNLLPPPRN